MSNESQKEVFVLCVDCNSLAWARRQGEHDDNQVPLSFAALVQNITVLVNTHTLLDSNKYIAVYGYGNQSCTLVYDPFATRDPSASVRLQAVEEISRGLAAVLKEDGLPPHKDTASPVSVLPCAMSRALCYIQRMSNIHPNIKAQLLVIQQSDDNGANYIQLMNTVFSAQKRDIPIHACDLGRHASVLLQQATHLTNGDYIRPPSQQHLASYLIGMYTADLTSRGNLRLPKASSIDLRARCFCHKRSIDYGLVCSVCLSIFCERVPRCATCDAEFTRAPPKPSSTSATGVATGSAIPR